MKKVALNIKVTTEAKEMAQKIAHKLYPEYGNKMISAVIEKLLLTIGPDLLAIEDYDPLKMALQQSRRANHGPLTGLSHDDQPQYPMTSTAYVPEEDDYYEEPQPRGGGLRELLS